MRVERGEHSFNAARTVGFVEETGWMVANVTTGGDDDGQTKCDCRRGREEQNARTPIFMSIRSVWYIHSQSKSIPFGHTRTHTQTKLHTKHMQHFSTPSSLRKSFNKNQPQPSLCIKSNYEINVKIARTHTPTQNWKYHFTPTTHNYGL